MPRYFFNVEGLAEDTEGMEMADLATAKCEAVTTAGCMICDGASTFWDRDSFVMTVADEQRLTLFTLHFIGTEAAATALSPLRGSALQPS